MHNMHSRSLPTQIKFNKKAYLFHSKLSCIFKNRLPLESLATGCIVKTTDQRKGDCLNDFIAKGNQIPDASSDPKVRTAFIKKKKGIENFSGM